MPVSCVWYLLNMATLDLSTRPLRNRKQRNGVVAYSLARETIAIHSLCVWQVWSVNIILYETLCSYQTVTLLMLLFMLLMLLLLLLIVRTVETPQIGIS